jgi:hypothetical protein
LAVAPHRTLFVDDNRDKLVAELFAQDGGRPELERILAAYGVGMAPASR